MKHDKTVKVVEVIGVVVVAGFEESDHQPIGNALGVESEGVNLPLPICVVVKV